ncbi:uncharacterized protein V6R79_023733 [Siganus canaliculatus]
MGKPRTPIQKKREGAGKSRKKLQAEELCEKVSICSTLDTAQNKQVKIKPQKDSQSLCLKFLQTEDYCVTISKAERSRGELGPQTEGTLFPSEEKASQMSEIRSFVRLFVGFILVATGASCPIELSPLHIVVKHGDPVSINCSTSESLFEGIGWEAKQGGTGVEPSNHSTWHVDSLTEWTISPKCFITPIPESSFEQCTRKPEVILYTFPEDTSMSSTFGSDGVMNEGKEDNFTCTILNIAPIQRLVVNWYKGDTVIQTQNTSGNSDPRPANHTSVMPYKAKREDNGVTFRCEAHLDLGPKGPLFKRTFQEYNITVHFGPVVECSSLELLEGDTLEEHCNVTGNPAPHVTWLKDGQPIDPSIPLSRKNSGWYTVEADGASSIQQTRQVRVQYGPELMCPSNYNFLENTPHNFTCTVEGYPQPETIWYKDGEEVVLPDTLTRNDAGQYVITASNRLSNVSVTVEINVTYSPSQIVELEDHKVDVGSDVSLKCSSLGNPRPTYEWNYYKTDNVIEETEDGVSLLHIKKANVYNMGSYTCHASNDRGKVSKTVNVLVKGVQHDCPIKITPNKMAVRYGDEGLNATCEPMSTENLEGKIYWQSLQGAISDDKTWFVDSRKDYDLSPACHATFRGIGACLKRLNFTLYKTPDSVSIHYVDNSSSVVEDRDFQLRCDITNVTPAQNLVVRWYRGNDTFETHTKVQVAGCLDDNDPGCNISVIRSPLNVSSTINVTLNRRHSGKHFRCEAQLDLGLEGWQPPPPDASDSLNITVQYKPIINTAKLPKTIPVFNGYPEELVCEADGYPPPKIVWVYSSTKMLGVSRVNLTVHEAGFYNCTASNEVDSVFHVVEVILKEDYLPLIAGFVAVTVVAISIVFVFIYSIYYKNTRMRRYSLKNPKLTQNGNVAHNSLQFPMTKLS